MGDPNPTWKLEKELDWFRRHHEGTIRDMNAVADLKCQAQKQLNIEIEIRQRTLTILREHIKFCSKPHDAIEIANDAMATLQKIGAILMENRPA